MPPPDLRVHCSACPWDGPAELHVWRCPRCAGALELTYPPLADVALTGNGLWRYAPWLPVAVDPVTLGEPATPLVPLAGRTVKLEGALPTGSFKDRGAAVLVAWLRAAGATLVVEDSSGNAGAALAAYAARAGIACQVHVPASAPAAKVDQLRAYGATPVLVDGPRSAATASAIDAAQAGAVYASHAWHPLYQAGTRTFAFELHEQLGGRAPDAIVVPTGGGALLLGAYLGFAALHAAGLVDRVPRLVAAQAAACAPLARAFAQGLEDPVAVDPVPSLADGIQVAAPVRGRQVLAALRATGGTAVTVTEEEIAAAHRGAARAGLLVERTAAVALAAADGVAGDEVVVAATGHGLKTPPTL